MRSTMPYCGIALDRASNQRTDSAWLKQLRNMPDSVVIPVWRDQCLVRDERPVTVPSPGAADVWAAAYEPVLLGMRGDTGVFAADLSDLDESDAVAMARADQVRDVRGLFNGLSEEEAGTLAYARGITHWNRNQRFCGACGGKAESRDGGHLRVCLDCGKLLFPRIEPAVIVLVELPGEPRRCLLARHAGAEPERFGTLAGFVEVGESLEDAVRREVAEEAGVTVGTVTYQGSQAWPFPAGLMVAFRAVAASESIAVDGAELVDARWFTGAELRARIADSGPAGLFRVDSIGKSLVHEWLAEEPEYGS